MSRFHFSNILFVNPASISGNICFINPASNSKTYFHHSSFQLSNISFINPTSISGNSLFVTPTFISATYFHHSVWGIHETFKIPVTLISYLATSCPRRVVRDELSATIIVLRRIVRDELSATNCPRRIVLGLIVRTPIDVVGLHHTTF